MLNRTFNKAGIAPNNAPPISPSTNIVGSVKTDCHSGNMMGGIDPINAPAMNCPSAPMFQLFER